jgi:hypothetical protein
MILQEAERAIPVRCRFAGAAKLFLKQHHRHGSHQSIILNNQDRIG